MDPPVDHPPARRGPARRALRTLAALAGALLLLELVLRGGFAAWVLRTGDPGCCAPGDRLCRVAAVYHGLLRGVEPSGVLPFDPRLGHRLAPGLRDHDFGAPLNSNAAGMRGRREYAEQPPPGVTRIAAVGDSFTFGQEVGDADTFPARLESGWRDVEVLNLGVPAYGLDQVVLRLEEDGLRFHPAVVVVGVVADDWTRARTDYFCGAKPVVRRDGTGVAIEGIPVPSPVEVRARVLAQPLAWILVRELALRLADRVPALRPEGDAPDNAEVAAGLMDRIAARAAAAGARALFVLLPWSPGDEGGADRRTFGAWCASRGADCIDAFPFFRAERERLGPEAFARTYYARVHLSPAGNRAVAGLVAARLGLAPAD